MGAKPKPVATGRIRPQRDGGTEGAGEGWPPVPPRGAPTGPEPPGQSLRDALAPNLHRIGANARRTKTGEGVWAAGVIGGHGWWPVGAGCSAFGGVLVELPGNCRAPFCHHGACGGSAALGGPLALERARGGHVVLRGGVAAVAGVLADR